MQPYLNDSWVRDFKRRQGWAWRSTVTNQARSDLGTTYTREFYPQGPARGAAAR